MLYPKPLGTFRACCICVVVVTLGLHLLQVRNKAKDKPESAAKNQVKIVPIQQDVEAPRTPRSPINSAPEFGWPCPMENMQEVKIVPMQQDKPESAAKNQVKIDPIQFEDCKAAYQDVEAIPATLKRSGSDGSDDSTASGSSDPSDHQRPEEFERGQLVSCQA
eukprot:symbB.v1.2.014037.t1/scaffold999.1/size145731/1